MRAQLAKLVRRLRASDLVNRTWRQVRQVVLVALVAAFATAQAQGGIQAVDWPTLAVAAGSGAVVVVLRALTGLRASRAASPWVQLADRSAAAAAGYILTIVTAGAFDWLHASWLTLLGGAAGAAVLAAGDGLLDGPPRAVTEG